MAEQMRDVVEMLRSGLRSLLTHLRESPGGGFASAEEEQAYLDAHEHDEPEPPGPEQEPELW